MWYPDTSNDQFRHFELTTSEDSVGNSDYRTGFVNLGRSHYVLKTWNARHFKFIVLRAHVRSISIDHAFQSQKHMLD